MHSLREQNAIAKSIKYNKKENIILHYCGSDQCGVTVWIRNIRVDQTSLEDLWHGLQFTSGGVLDQQLWSDL